MILTAFLTLSKISVSYAEKSFWTPKTVATRIQQGATRNLLIRGIDSALDEERLRTDLDHIHNLVIVEVYPPKNESGIVVSMNAINLALYAKTCLRSQAKYKKAQISFYPDKCAEMEIPDPRKEYKPLQDKTNGKTSGKRLAKSDGPPKNRFQLLSIEDEEDGEDDETADEGVELGSPASELA